MYWASKPSQDSRHPWQSGLTDGSLVNSGSLLELELPLSTLNMQAVNVINATITSHGCDAQNSPWARNKRPVFTMLMTFVLNLEKMKLASIRVGIRQFVFDFCYIMHGWFLEKPKSSAKNLKVVSIWTCYEAQFKVDRREEQTKKSSNRKFNVWSVRLGINNWRRSHRRYLKVKQRLSFLLATTKHAT